MIGFQDRQQALADLHARLAACRLCLEAGYEIYPRAIHSGKLGAQILLIGQAPGIIEKKAGRAFNAGSGRRLFQWLAETALQNCPQRRKFVVVLHDGDPVYKGAEGNDLTLSHTHIRRLERAGITVIGIYLGDDSELVTKLKRLFPHWIVCSNNDLPDKLGNLLKSLA